MEEITPADLDRYFLGLIKDDRSYSYVNQAISALRFWMRLPT
ncbi:hypothetical protein [Paenibacillus macerans]